MKKLINILFLTQIVISLGCADKKSGEKLGDAQETQITDNHIRITQAQFEDNNMKLGNVEKKLFPVMVQANGLIDVPPENRAVVSALMGGYVKQTSLLVGDTVKKGQALLTIENPEFVTLQQNYLEVTQKLAYLKAEYDRQVILKRENISSQKSFLKAKSDFESAEATYKGLRKQLNLLRFSITSVEAGNISSTATIYAPIGGSITSMNVTKGTYVSPATNILEIVDNKHIHLELVVYEKDIMKLKKGQAIQFKIPEASNDMFEAEVYLIGTAIDENRTIKVHGHIVGEEQHNFLTGMFIEAQIVLNNNLEQSLPSEAIVEQNNAFFVLKLVKDNLFQKVAVKPLGSANGFTAITFIDLVEAEASYLISGAYDVLSEDPND